MSKNQVTHLKKISDKKNKNEKLLKIAEKLISDKKINMTKKTTERIKDCATYLEFLADRNLENLKLKSGIFCKNRFCPICSKKKSIKNACEIKIITDYISCELKRKFLFVTLTAPNVCGNELDKEITKYNLAFKKLVERKIFKKAIKGYLRKLEVTYNKKTNMYHPHFHIVLSVTSSYFVNDYIKRDCWLKNWQEVMQDNSITQVDVRRFKKNNDDKLDKSILEITKYIAKDSNYLTDEKVFENFYNALKSKKELSFSGDFKIARDLYKKGLLDKYKKEELIVWYYLIKNKWQNKKYTFEKKILK